MLQPGTTLQRGYVIEKVLGQGGMGAVYLARQNTLGGRRVAVKETIIRIDDPAIQAQVVEQFQREAEILASIDHPNLVDVKDYFEENGSQYLVMAFIDGETCEEVLNRSPQGLAIDQVLGWMDQLCDVLTVLHEHVPPVIVRDLKPSNVMVDHAGRVRLIDFGIARIDDGAGGPKTSTFLKGAGTVGFAPVEQFGGGGTDARSDVYSLGATIYALLTRSIPPWSMQMATGEAVLQPPSALNSGVTPQLDAVLMRMMAVRRDQRYATVREARRALKDARGTVEEGAPSISIPRRFCMNCGTTIVGAYRACTQCGDDLQKQAEVLSAASGPAPVQSGGTPLAPPSTPSSSGSGGWAPPSSPADSGSGSGGWAPPSSPAGSGSGSGGWANTPTPAGSGSGGWAAPPQSTPASGSGGWPATPPSTPAGSGSGGWAGGASAGSGSGGWPTGGGSGATPSTSLGPNGGAAPSGELPPGHNMYMDHSQTFGHPDRVRIYTAPDPEPRRNLTPVLAIIALLALVGAGVSFMMGRHDPTPAPSVSPTPVASASTSASVAASPSGSSVAVATPAPTVDPQAALKTCESNLKNMATAIEMWSTDNSGRYPKALKEIVPNYVKALPTCPAADDMSYSYERSQSLPIYTVACAGWYHKDAHVARWHPLYDATEGLQVQNPAIDSNPQSAEQFYQRGFAFYQRGDYDRAVSDLNRASSMLPRWSAPYYYIGECAYEQKRYQEALDAYTRAIGLYKAAYLYKARAQVYHQLGDNEKSLSDLLEANKLQKNDLDTWGSVAFALYNMGKFKESVEVCDDILKRDLKNEEAYVARYWCELCLGEGAAAATDCQSFLSNVGWHAYQSPYSVIVGYFAYQMEHRDAEAKGILDTGLKRLKRNWPYPVVQYLAGQITADQMLGQATDKERQTEAHCYLGLKAAIEGSKGEARKQFEWVRDNGYKPYFEYRASLSWLNRI